MTLATYPEYFPLGFSRSRWQELRRDIDAKDDQPFDRDERRAWYDTLRDLVPLIHGNQLGISRSGYEPRSRPKGMLAPFENPI
ncbi:MAG: hypothetical protein EXR70_07170 [Deltaproteobacteria bacterium]|nr:hypothetical protein [Deltaproteobacteria bacterium]